jgi:5'-3' exonuclease
MRDGDLFWDFGARSQFGYHDIERYFGVAPERFADYLALTGDSTDNIPGVPGVGHRTAALLMKAFGSLDELYADLERVACLPLRGAATLGARLAAHKESAYLARRLTRIACDLSLGVSACALRRRMPDLPALGELYDRLGFGPYLRRQGERLAQLPEAQATPSAA